MNEFFSFITRSCNNKTLKILYSFIPEKSSGVCRAAFLINGGIFSFFSFSPNRFCLSEHFSAILTVKSFIIQFMFFNIITILFW